MTDQKKKSMALALSLLRDAVFLVGAGLIVAGVWMIYVPAALIVTGVLLAVFAIRGLR